MVGNIANYSREDIVRVFLQLDTKISRNALRKNLALGEGSIRSILDILKKKELIESKQQGHRFSDKGQKLFDSMMDAFGKICLVKTGEYPKLIEAAVIVKKEVKFTILHRDIAVRHGAHGALFLEYDEKLMLPEIEKDYSELASQLRLERGNQVIVCFSELKSISENACIAILKQIFTKNFDF